MQKKATSTSAITRTQNRRRFPGPGPKKFKPGYWTYWSPWSKSKIKTETVFIFVVQDEGLYRNVCSATLDAEKFPYLRTTALWLRCIFAALELFPTSRKWLVEWMLYVQLQVIYYKYGYWEYHGGINALRWWKWTHPWAYKRYPARTARLQYRSQYFLSKAVQGAYYCVGKSLFGMKGDYSQYNPRLGQSFLLAEASAINSEKT
ncbi:hypothetical protein N7G274_007014 [Stereocaulon virgatum]|uniref:Uncharacterized protein n=1 Tax=Stereocaulon virgatum TaxID=373712 RepID=A0ABR4A598_9LECA